MFVEEKRSIAMLKKLLGKVYRMTRKQALNVLHFYGEEKPEDTLEYLIRRMEVFERGDLILVKPNTDSNYEVCLAMYLYLKFMGKVDFDSIYLAQSPASIFFLMNNEMFDITIVDIGSEERILKTMDATIRGTDLVNHILVCYEGKQLDILYDLQQKEYERLNIHYALIDKASITEKPNILILKKKEA